LITAGQSGVFIFKFNYSGKYSPEMAVKVDVLGIYISIELSQRIQTERTLESCKGLKIDKKAGVLMSWNRTSVSFNELIHDARLLAQYENVYTSDEKTTDLLVYPKQRYFIAATNEGKIHIFKYKPLHKVEHHGRIVHTFTGHSKSVTSICKFQGKGNLILSVSLDGTARIWCTNTFQHHYTFQLTAALKFV